MKGCKEGYRQRGKRGEIKGQKGQRKRSEDKETSGETGREGTRGREEGKMQGESCRSLHVRCKSYDIRDLNIGYEKKLEKR